MDTFKRSHYRARARHKTLSLSLSLSHPSTEGLRGRHTHKSFLIDFFTKTERGEGKFGGERGEGEIEGEEEDEEFWVKQRSLRLSGTPRAAFSVFFVCALKRLPPPPPPPPPPHFFISLGSTGLMLFFPCQVGRPHERRGKKKKQKWWMEFCVKGEREGKREREKTDWCNLGRRREEERQKSFATNRWTLLCLPPPLVVIQ